MLFLVGRFLIQVKVDVGVLELSQSGREEVSKGSLDDAAIWGWLGDLGRLVERVLSRNATYPAFINKFCTLILFALIRHG